MQYDMHYYGTYAMAAAAGLPQHDAEIIATASQFVDDQNVATWALAPSGEGVHAIATAHHPIDAGVRALMGKTEGNDTRLVWVPFHFMPGGEGNTFHERMVCRKDSRIVNRVLDHYLQKTVMDIHRPHALHLMGIAAHVYADTFSHCGFSGIRSEVNQIQANSLDIDPDHADDIKEQLQESLHGLFSSFAGASDLGHGAALTYPDQPYLRWGFTTVEGIPIRKNNPEAFLAACKALHGRFKQLAQNYYANPPPVRMDWPQLEAPVRTILETEAPTDDRVQLWLDAMRRGSLRQIPVCKEYDPTTWEAAMQQLENADSFKGFDDSDPYKFFTAADYHRNFVLKRLLPSRDIGIMVA